MSNLRGRLRGIERALLCRVQGQAEADLSRRALIRRFNANVVAIYGGDASAMPTEPAEWEATMEAAIRGVYG